MVHHLPLLFIQPSCISPNMYIHPKHKLTCMHIYIHIYNNLRATVPRTIHVFYAHAHFSHRYLFSLHNHTHPSILAIAEGTGRGLVAALDYGVEREATAAVGGLSRRAWGEDFRFSVGDPEARLRVALVEEDSEGQRAFREGRGGLLRWN